MAFKDHFSGHAASYAEYRPGYPEALFAFLADCCDRRRHAWDCATGNGQTAISLAAYFDRVTATDASAAQIQAAKRHAKVEYRVAAAEDSGLADGSADLLTVAQALHWFDVPRFFEEALRVLAARGVLAVWSYELCLVDPDIDAIVRGLYEDVDAWWPAERRIVEDRYRGIELPVPELASPEFDMITVWSVDAMLGYLRTWSACQRCLRDRGTDPVTAIENALSSRWGTGEREVRWPLALKLGKRPSS